ncbi:calcium-binding protein [Microvirga guangxiensis]|uniref:Hemolysin-type calcium-binding repeat-containing protein n=1 Tax=Microvirga guangxiensis TaxID=549386 RepID=A0A1G5DVV8_9HYPH|nr:calcium-binding protein [Microvirga guangxiensis]SCY18892.1 Hemolysin-type calcium-binding repeat-containing protein [Microvirga guangxiensis]
MAIYNSWSNSFTLEANELVFALPATVPGTTTPLPAQVRIQGNALANVLTGDATHNGLDGGAGADRMIGGAGDDWYTVDDVGDVVVELAGEGTADTVQSSVSYTLAANVEILMLLGTGNINGTGNELDNDIFGNSGDNILDGGAGNDHIYASSGGNDQIIGGLGIDTVHYSSTAALTINLATGTGQGGEAAGDTYSGIENVSTGFGNDRLVGSSGSNYLDGGYGKDTIQGGSGNDRVSGGMGNDVLYGGKGKDAFVFKSQLDPYKNGTNRTFNFDTIKDFNVRDDSIWLSKLYFTKLSKVGSEDKPGKLKAAFFTIGTKAKDKNDYLIYNDKSGILSYDADGSGSGKAIQFAKLNKNLKLTYKDFFVI